MRFRSTFSHSTFFSCLALLFLFQCAPANDQEAAIQLRLDKTQLRNAASLVDASLSSQYCFALHAFSYEPHPELRRGAFEDPAICKLGPSALGQISGFHKLGTSVFLSLPIANKVRFDLVGFRRDSNSDLAETCDHTLAARLGTQDEDDVDLLLVNKGGKVLETEGDVLIARGFLEQIQGGGNVVALETMNDSAGNFPEYQCADRMQILNHEFQHEEGQPENILKSQLGASYTLRVLCPAGADKVELYRTSSSGVTMTATTNIESKSFSATGTQILASCSAATAKTHSVAEFVFSAISGPYGTAQFYMRALQDSTQIGEQRSFEIRNPAP